MRFTDSHCHLAMTGGAEEGLLEAARRAGVAGFVVPGTRLEDSAAAVALAAHEADVWAAVGFHPHEARDCDDAAFARLAGLAAAERVVAIGEAGLDFHYMHSPRETQIEVLRRHIGLAKERDLPIILHNRQSTADLLAVLESEESRGVRGILHSYTEDLETARRLVDLGFVISFSGIVTFRTAEPLREVARSLPLDAVLIETDTPYLAPVPHRGRDNQPAWVVEVARLLASLWSVPIEEVAARTTANFERVFRVKLPS